MAEIKSDRDFSPTELRQDDISLEELELWKAMATKSVSLRRGATVVFKGKDETAAAVNKLYDLGEKHTQF